MGGDVACRSWVAKPGGICSWCVKGRDCPCLGTPETGVSEVVKAKVLPDGGEDAFGASLLSLRPSAVVESTGPFDIAHSHIPVAWLTGVDPLAYHIAHRIYVTFGGDIDLGGGPHEG